ncbi:MAG: 16S rRNA (cytosine(1402)-N(4))-methyltransferase RsmH [Firmicutes bacterium]|nr:16S rRNA (cytosine(1402)-N(4))-methyltransferase RsmH [Bacillota bacterium]
MSTYHAPVMLCETIDFLKLEPGKLYVDATAGGGGHSEAIIKKIYPTGKLIAIDRDEAALHEISKRLKYYSDTLILVHDNFINLKSIADRLNISKIDGILFDLGVSSYQLNEASRGFSFKFEGPLDMRMDISQPTTAADLVNSLSEEELKEIIAKYGEERWAGRIAKAIVDERRTNPVTTTTRLAKIVESAVPRKAWPDKIHVATRTFQALRIAVNSELPALKAALGEAIGLLVPGGRIVVISYHSLEDRIVKETYIEFLGRCKCPPDFPVCVCGRKKQIEILTKKPVLPGADEIARNPRARSAKLRAATKL